MNRKIILSIATFVLALAGVAASRSQRSIPGSVAFKSTAGTCHILFNSSVPINFTTTGGANQAMIRSIGGTLLGMYTVTCNKKVYFLQ